MSARMASNAVEIPNTSLQC